MLISLSVRDQQLIWKNEYIAMFYSLIKMSLWILQLKSDSMMCSNLVVSAPCNKALFAERICAWNFSHLKGTNDLRF